MKNFRWDKKYLYWGITAFCVFVAAITFYAVVTHLGWIRAAISKLTTILSPFIWGFVIAYLLHPLLQLLEKQVFKPFEAWLFKDRPAKPRKIARGLSVLFSMIALILIVVAMIWLIAPRLIQSIESIINNSALYVKKVYDWIDKFLVDYPEMEAVLSSSFGNLSNGVLNWLENTILPRASVLISSLTTSVYLMVKGIYNILIGMIVAVYVLFNKELFSGYAKKIVYCVFSVEASEKVLMAVDFVDHVFMGFLSGKILDSAIIGVLCYIGCLILKMPYALLVAFIVGITNIIPFFGPFIGAIPSALIIFMESPLQCLFFILFIIVLQQFDGNILGPKILGNSVGVNGFWIMFSIIVGAGFFGFFGMLLGVPVFVILFTAIKALVNRKLMRSGLPTDGDYYRNMRYIDPESGEAVLKENTTRRRKKQAHPWMTKNGGRNTASAVKKSISKKHSTDGEDTSS